jgi:hypothetical protein
MRITKYFFTIIFFTYFFTSSVVSLERDYDSCAAGEFYYCDSHQKASNRLSLIGEYLSLIPPSPSSRCYHVDCSKCHHAWCFESEDYYYDEEEDEEALNIETHWTCDCGFDGNEIRGQLAPLFLDLYTWTFDKSIGFANGFVKNRAQC